jgi:HAD superfamily phosphoserine phosphatase-like hydrolase
MSTNRVHYLVASDFDQTLSYNDSGLVLSELIGVRDFEARVRGLARQNFVQQGAELAYLLRHDPEFRGVRREQLLEAGKRIRLKRHVPSLPGFLDGLSEEHRFFFYVISAAPREVVESALEGIVPPDHIFGSRFELDAAGEMQAIVHCPAGYGKVTVLDELVVQRQIGKGRIVYMGDGSSDVHVMLHVNRLGGLTIAVSENRHIKPVAKRTVLSEDALGTMVPILEEILGWDAPRIQKAIEAHGCLIKEWDKISADSLVIGEPAAA